MNKFDANADKKDLALDNEDIGFSEENLTALINMQVHDPLDVIIDLPLTMTICKLVDWKKSYWYLKIVNM